MRCTWRSRATSSSSCSSVTSPRMTLAAFGGAGFRFLRMNARARSRKLSRLSCALSLDMRTLFLRDQIRQAPQVRVRCAEQRSNQRVPPQKQVQVVLEGHADAAVQLHTVLEQL